jgi:hypothetical protein
MMKKMYQRKMRLPKWVLRCVEGVANKAIHSLIQPADATMTFQSMEVIFLRETRLV